MNHDTYVRKLDKVIRQTHALHEQAERVLAQHDSPLMVDLLNQLSEALEELHTSQEELRQQADELKGASDELEVERQRYRDLFDLAPDAYLVTNAYGQIQEANQAASELLGLANEHLVRKPLVSFIPELERAAFRNELGRLTVFDTARTWETHLQPRIGPLLDVEFTVGMARGVEGQAVALRWLVRDVTKRKQAEHDLHRSRRQLQALNLHSQRAREEERSHMAREIHDQLGGDLTALKMDVMWLERHMPEDAALVQRTRQMIAMIDSTIQTVRQLAAELRPSVLDDLGLVSAIEWQLNEFQNRTGLECRLKADMKDTRLNDEHATALFRLFQEALTNIARHAQATRVEVGLAQEGEAIRLEVADNGRGITPEAVKDPTAWGLIGMRERAALLSGRVDFEGSPGQGTTVAIRIPLK